MFGRSLNFAVTVTGPPSAPGVGVRSTFGEDRYPLRAGKGDEAIFWEVAIRVWTSPGAVWVGRRVAEQKVSGRAGRPFCREARPPRHVGAEYFSGGLKEGPVALDHVGPCSF